MAKESEFSEDRWAQFRFSVIGSLLSAPPPPGRLKEALEELSRKEWRHPMDSHKRVFFSFSTLERWYYTALSSRDPIAALRRATRKDAGKPKAFSTDLVEAARDLYRKHPTWSIFLHHKNLGALCRKHLNLGPLPSYSTLVRFFAAQGWRRRRRARDPLRPGLSKARARLEKREVRSYEFAYVGGLWHLDFHGSKFVTIVLPNGRRVFPELMATLDDHSRLCCHGQFYQEKSAEVLVHALSQAFLKRGLPRSLLTDNGGEMTARETTQGLARLAIHHETTLPYSPYQNGKQEHFWDVVEGQFLAMLENVPDLDLQKLNTYFQVWIEKEYNQNLNSEMGSTPLDRFLHSPNVSRPAPSPQKIKEAFRQRAWRVLRRSDCTVSLQGVRFEIPSAFRHWRKIPLLYAQWDLGLVHIADPKTGDPLRRIFPVDKVRNASGERRALTPGSLLIPPPSSSGDLPPLLQEYLEEFAASGRPPGFLPGPENHGEKEDLEESEKET